MNAIAVIFTHPPDYATATIASRFAERLGVKVVWAIDHDASLEGIPADRDVVLSYVPRRGNLVGALWTAEQLRIMDEVSHGYTWVIKLDSDTVINRLDWLESAKIEHQIVGMYNPYGGGSGQHQLHGQCYAVRGTALPSLRQSARLTDPAFANWGEDALIGGILEDSQQLKHPFHRRKGMMSGWHWPTDREAAYWIERYEVLTIQRPGAPSDNEEGRRSDVRAIMTWLEASHLQSLQTPPSLLKRAATLSKALASEGKAILSGEEKLTESEISSRLSVCSKCPDFIESTNTCGICYCYLPAKTRFRTQHCPAGKW